MSGADYPMRLRVSERELQVVVCDFIVFQCALGLFPRNQAQNLFTEAMRNLAGQVIAHHIKGEPGLLQVHQVVQPYDVNLVLRAQQQLVKAERIRRKHARAQQREARP